jgi:hypothetical protein
MIIHRTIVLNLNRIVPHFKARLSSNSNINSKLKQTEKATSTNDFKNIPTRTIPSDPGHKNRSEKSLNQLSKSNKSVVKPIKTKRLEISSKIHDHDWQTKRRQIEKWLEKYRVELVVDKGFKFEDFVCKVSKTERKGKLIFILWK